MKSGVGRSADGFTLTEVAIVLGVAGLMLGSIWTAANSVYQNRKASTAANEAIVISQAVNRVFAGQALPTSVGELTPMLITAGAFPSDMALQTFTDPNWGAAKRPTHPWGSYLSVYAISATTFRISFYNLPIAGCVAFASAVAGNTGRAAPIAVGSWFTAAAQGSNPAVPYGASNNITLQNGVPFTPTVAAAMCGGSVGNPATSGAVSTEFDFSVI